MHRDNNNESTFFLIQLFILLMLNTMIRTQYETLQDIGNLSIYMTLIVMFVFLVCSFIKRKELNFSNVYVTLFLFILVNFFSFLLTDHVDSIYLMTLLMFYLFILSSIRVEWKPVHIKVLTYILGVLLIFLFIHWVQLGFPDTRFKSIFQNPNYLAVLLFVMLYFKLLTIKYGNVIDKVYVLTLILLNFILIYSTNTRSVLLAAVVILVSWIVMKGFQRVFPYLFHITIIANVFFIFF